MLGQVNGLQTSQHWHCAERSSVWTQCTHQEQQSSLIVLSWKWLNATPGSCNIFYFYFFWIIHLARQLHWSPGSKTDLLPKLLWFWSYCHIYLILRNFTEHQSTFEMFPLKIRDKSLLVLLWMDNFCKRWCEAEKKLTVRTFELKPLENHVMPCVLCCVRHIHKRCWAYCTSKVYMNACHNGSACVCVG